MLVLDFLTCLPDGDIVCLIPNHPFFGDDDFCFVYSSNNLLALEKRYLYSVIDTVRFNDNHVTIFVEEYSRDD